jgi:hypothetical protein
MITNEDDCSAANPPAFYSAADNSLSAPLGPTGNFRCAEFGYLCGGARPVRLAPNGLATDTKTYDNCVPDEQGQLIPVATFAAAIKALKPDPANQILVASIQGPADTFETYWKPGAMAGDPPVPDIQHSCVAADTSYADPGIRTRQFVRSFGGNGLEYSICEANFGPALKTIANKVSELLKPKCVAGQVALRASSTVEDCSVIEQSPGENQKTIQRTLPACADTAGAAPCWRFVAGTGPVADGGNGCDPDERMVETVREGMPPDNTRISVACAMCVPGMPDPAHGCPQ